MIDLEHARRLAPKYVALGDNSSLGASRDRTGGINESPESLRAYLESRGLVIANVKTLQGMTVFVLNGCPMNPEHGMKSDTAVILRADGKVGFKCCHNGCSTYGWKDVRSRIDPGYGKRASSGQSGSSGRDMVRLERQVASLTARVDKLEGSSGLVIGRPDDSHDDEIAASRRVRISANTRYSIRRRANR